MSEDVLRRYRFDPELFEELRRRVAAGELSPAGNRVRGEVEPPHPDDLERVPEPGEPAWEEAYEEGLAAYGRGEVAVAVLNGGMATRFGGVVKGVVEAVEGLSFLELKAREARRAAEASGGDVPFVVMNGFATDEATRAFATERDVGDPLFFSQSVLLRLTPEGELHLEDGAPSPYSPGHGDFVPSLRASGLIEELRGRGVRTVLVSNVDNLGARPDPVVLGLHRRSGRGLTAEVVAKAPGDRGGAPARVDGRTVHVEDFAWPAGFDASRVGVFGTNTFHVDLDVLDADYPLTWFYVEKRVGDRTAVQLERLVNELTWFVPATFLEVPRAGRRGRFFPVKEPEDLEAVRPQLRELLGASPFAR